MVVNAEGIPGAAGQPLGPYTPGSDVSFEVRTNAATEQLVGILSDPAFVDWDSAREAFEAAPAPIRRRRSRQRSLTSRDAPPPAR